MVFIEAVGLKGLIAATKAVGDAIARETEKGVVELAYKVEDEIKLRTPVYSGRLYSSIGNKSPTAAKNPGGVDGSEYAIWEKRKSGRNTEVELGSAVVNPYSGEAYAPIAEFTGFNIWTGGQIVEGSASGNPSGMAQSSHFFEDGARAAMNKYFESIFGEGVDTALLSTWAKPSVGGVGHAIYYL